MGPDHDQPIWGLSFSTNTWYHIVLGYDGNGEGYGYVNKTLQTLHTDNDPPTDFTSNTDFYLGNRHDNANRFVGQMKKKHGGVDYYQVLKSVHYKKNQKK